MIATNLLNITTIKKNNKLLKVNHIGVKTNTGSAYSLNYIYNNNLDNKTENKQEGNYDNEINILTSRLNTVETNIVEFDNSNSLLLNLSNTVNDLNGVVNENIGRLDNHKTDITNIKKNILNNTDSINDNIKRLDDIENTDITSIKEDILDHIALINDNIKRLDVIENTDITSIKEDILDHIALINDNIDTLVYYKIDIDNNSSFISSIEDDILINTDLINDNIKRLDVIENTDVTVIDINNTLPLTMIKTYGEINKTYSYDIKQYNIFKDNDYFTFESWLYTKGSDECFLFAVVDADIDIDNLDTGDYNTLSAQCLIHVISTNSSIIINNMTSQQQSIYKNTWTHFAIQGDLNSKILKININNNISYITLDSDISKKNSYKLLLGAGTSTETYYTNIRISDKLVYNDNEYNTLTFPLLKPLLKKNVVFNYVKSIRDNSNTGYVDNQTYKYLSKNDFDISNTAVTVYITVLSI